MSQLNVANGNIGHSLSFPLAWEENGHYKVTEAAEPGFVVVHSKQLGDSLPLRAQAADSEELGRAPGGSQVSGEPVCHAHPFHGLQRHGWEEATLADAG
eukprot:2830864-Amphidinium_carterae.1